MATKNPRLTITLTPSLAAQLRRLSELTGNSQSSLIAELLDGSGPVFDKMIQVLEAAAVAKDSIRGRIAGDLDEAQRKLEGALSMAQEGFDLFTKPLLEEAEAVGRRARQGHAKAGRGGRGGTPPTPISNRGVRLDPIATKSIAPNEGQDSEKSGKSGVKIRGGNKGAKHGAF